MRDRVQSTFELDADGGPAPVDPFGDFAASTLDVWSSCRRKIRNWRVPPRWTVEDWADEMKAESLAAALQAELEYDPGRKVPWEAFLRRRIMAAALTRYRREWRFVGRCAGTSDQDVSMIPSRQDEGPDEKDLALILRSLTHLPMSDRRIVEGIYWGGCSERHLAGEIGVTQQAVNKRKRAILATLREILLAFQKDNMRL